MNIKDKAKEFAIKAHSGQFRKSEKDKPMIIHPINVGKILESFGFDDNVVAAGYLHDVVEDTKYTSEDIMSIFGEDICSLVLGASEPDKTLSWEERKAHTIKESGKLDLRHKAVIAADKINNLENLERIMNTNENFSFSNFNRGYKDQKWYHTSLHENIIRGETHPIFKKYTEVIKRTFDAENTSEKDYLSSRRFNDLKELHYLKYEIKSLKNTLENETYVVEFTGTPRTGKTSIINKLNEFFCKGGYKTCVVEEFTTSKLYKETIYPKLKDSSKSVVNTEIAKYVNEQLNEVLKNNYDIILIDRSLFDRCIWVDRLSLKDGVTKEAVENYYETYIPLIKKNIDLVVATYCDSLESMKRDYMANLSLEKRNFLNEQNINEYNISLKNAVELLNKNKYEVSLFDTNNTSLVDTEIIIAKTILENMRFKYYNKFIETYCSANK